VGPNPTEPASILSRIQKLYSSIRRIYSKEKLRAGKAVLQKYGLKYFAEMGKIGGIRSALEKLEGQSVT
jgi:hypothetical protein